MKYVGPTKKMMKALEDEGLYVDWPKTGNVKDEELLAIEGSFTTGPDWEKGVLIDLRHMVALDSKSGVDKAVANQLQEEYDNYDVDEEVKLNLEGSEAERNARGVPDAARLVDDIKEKERRLKRFAEVANAVAEGRKIPEEEDGNEITISGNDAKLIVEVMGRAISALPVPVCVVKELMDKINRQLGK